jgi:hypothetical protein
MTEKDEPAKTNQLTLHDVPFHQKVPFRISNAIRLFISTTFNHIKSRRHNYSLRSFARDLIIDVGFLSKFLRAEKDLTRFSFQKMVYAVKKINPEEFVKFREIEKLSQENLNIKFDLNKPENQIFEVIGSSVNLLSREEIKKKSELTEEKFSANFESLIENHYIVPLGNSHYIINFFHPLLLNPPLNQNLIYKVSDSTRDELIFLKKQYEQKIKMLLNSDNKEKSHAVKITFEVNFDLNQNNNTDHF